MTNDDRIAQELVATKDWDARQARLGLRAKFLCEYCELDFFASPENFKQWTQDHIVPLHRGGIDDFDNLALACRTCNFSFKVRWDPPDKNASRQERLAAARRYIHEQKQQFEKRMAQWRAIIGR